MLQINFENRCVLVTGGASGIGKEMAETFLRNGAKVAIVDLDIAPELTQEFKNKPPGMILVYQGDVTSERSIEEVIGKVTKEWGTIDILINNAGVIYKAPAEEIDINRWRNLIEVNLTGPVICTKKVVPLMKRQKWGRIVNISSMMAFIGAETYSAYGASKAGLLQLTKVWAVELARHGITVNAICPGWVETPMVQGFIQRIAEIHEISCKDALKKIFSIVPQQRFIATSEVASLALFLASDIAKGINGAGIVIDTGLTAGMPAGIHRKIE